MQLLRRPDSLLLPPKEEGDALRSPDYFSNLSYLHNLQKPNSVVLGQPVHWSFWSMSKEDLWTFRKSFAGIAFAASSSCVTATLVSVFPFFRSFSWQSNIEKWPEKHRRYAPTKENQVEPYLSINQHQSALISINQNQSASIKINQHQSASINICNWLGNYIYRHKYSKFLRSVRKL